MATVRKPAEREPSDEGVHFALVDGRRSSQLAGKSVFASAARYSDARLADRIEGIDDWRKGYVAPVRDLVALGARSSKNALRIATDGLEALQRDFVFIRDGATVPLGDAFEEFTEPRFFTSVVRGRGKGGERKVSIPYKGRLLVDDELKSQLDSWQAEGKIEPSCARAVALVAANPQWLDLSDLHLAVLGAASEMGPLEWLCRWGAAVLAVDLPKPELWNRIISLALDGSGEVFVPTRTEVEDPDEIPRVAGADLITDAPEIKTWLSSFGTSLVLGNYVYADGATFCRLATAVDALVDDLTAKGLAAATAYLATPTDVFAVPPEVVKGAKAARRAVLAPLGRRLSGGRLFVPSYRELVRAEDGRQWGIYDCLVPQQGANYALAKSLQRWRSVKARDGGLRTSANVAPATTTRSVVQNKVLAAAYAGAKPFGVEVFDPATSRALMATLLVHDLRGPSVGAEPVTAPTHPYDLFTEGAAHGGLWRMAHEPRSVLPLAVLLGFARPSRRSR